MGNSPGFVVDKTSKSTRKCRNVMTSQLLVCILSSERPTRWVDRPRLRCTS